jgi:thioredoxin type arsenate reductase
MTKKILVLCTGNSCRSQIAHGYLQKFANGKVKVYSAGVETHGVNPKAIAIMKEDDVDISNHTSNNIDEYRNIDFDFVITVCDNAKERCPFFPTSAQKFHQNFPDPAKATGTESEIMNAFRKVRDEIKDYCKQFVEENIYKNQNKMINEAEIKEMVKQKYSEIALQDKETNAASCCGVGGCSTEVYNIMSEDYSQLDGYNADADLGLGCGLPTQFAKIKKGDTVIDLGSGAGNDCFVARAETGESGKVIGIDFTEAMIDKARANAEKRGFNNVEFRFGDIEKMPVSANVADVVVSNCVLNLVPDKQAVFKEINRVLKAGGHFSISDIVLTGELPEKIRSTAEMYAGCVSGAIDKKEYLSYIEQAGFQNITLQKEKPIIIPDDILQNYLTDEEIAVYKTNPTIIRSITVYAEKKGCNYDSGCC